MVRARCLRASDGILLSLNVHCGKGIHIVAQTVVTHKGEPEKPTYLYFTRLLQLPSSCVACKITLQYLL